MHPSLKTIAGTALLFILSACGSLPTKSSAPLNSALIPRVPSADSESLNIRTGADYNFILGEVYSHEGNSSRAIESFEKALTMDPNSSSIHMQLSAELLKTDKITEAIFHAEQSLLKDPKNIEAHLFLGGLYAKENRFNDAISQYKTAMQLQPENNEAPVYIGALYADMRDYKKAEQYFKSLLKNPKYETPHVAHYYLGTIYQDQKGKKSQKAAEDAFRKSLNLNPDFEEATLALANLYLRQNEVDKALSLCLEFQEQNQFHRSLSDLIVQIHLKNGSFDKAYEQLEVIARKSDTSPEIQMKMALILIEEKKYHLAATKLKEIVTKFPDADSARYYLAAVHEETGAVDSAIREYMLVPPSSSQFSDAVVRAAQLLKDLGKLNKALDITEHGLKAKADQPQVYTMYASLLDAKSDYLGAARALETGLNKFSHNVSLLFQHAVMMDRLGKKDQMIEQMKKVLEIEPDHVESMSYLAFSFAELNQNLIEAEKLARRALELQPTDGYVLDTLGWVLYKQNKFAESIQILEKAYAYQSSASIIAEHLADAYAMQSRKEDAKGMYAKAMDLTSNETRVTQIRTKLRYLSF